MHRFLHNDFYFNDRFLLVNSLELALRYIIIIIMAFTVLLKLHARVDLCAWHSTMDCGFDQLPEFQKKDLRAGFVPSNPVFGGQCPFRIGYWGSHPPVAPSCYRLVQCPRLSKLCFTYSLGRYNGSWVRPIARLQSCKRRIHELDWYTATLSFRDIALLITKWRINAILHTNPCLVGRSYPVSVEMASFMMFPTC